MHQIDDEADYREAERAALRECESRQRDEYLAAADDAALRALEDSCTDDDRRAFALWRAGIHADEQPIRIDALGEPGAPVKFVADALLPEGQVVLLCGEEGAGKSYIAWQIAGELTRGVPVLGAFAVPSPVRSVLIVDVEQSPEDVRIIRDEMVARGTIDPDAPIYFLDANGRVFDNPDDFVWLVRTVQAVRPEVLILDTMTDAVSDPKNDEVVRALKFLCGRFLREEGVRVVIGLAQPRKLGGDGGRRTFDSLFGSRMWKSFCSAAFWLTSDRLSVWKQRGRYVEKRWPKEPGDRNVWVPLERPEEGAPTIVGSKVGNQWAADARRMKAEEERRTKVVEVLAAADGLSTRALRKTVTGRNEEIDATLASLEAEHLIENRGTDARSDWFVATAPRAPTAPRARPGRAS